MNHIKKGTAGNALFLILIAIFLLGGVTALLVRTGGTSEETGSTERLTIDAAEFLRNAAGLNMGVQQLLARGCSENEISFDIAASIQDYDNPNSPADESCHIFSAKGAGLQYIIIKEQYLANTTTNFDGQPVFYAGVGFEDVGTDHTELSVNYNDLTKEMCMAINRVLGIPNVANDAPSDTMQDIPQPAFKGVFPTGNITDFVGDSVTGFAGKKGVCVKRTDAGNMYQFLYVLIAK